MQRALKERIKAALDDAARYARSGRAAVQASDGEAFRAYLAGARFALTRAEALWSGAVDERVVGLVERLGSEDDADRVAAAEALEDWLNGHGASA